MSSEVEAALDRLFQCAPNEFVRQRDALSRDLKLRGEADVASRIKRLPRPSPTAWAINQLAFGAAADLLALFEAAASLRAAHQDGAADGIQSAGNSYRRALEALTKKAQQILDGAGYSADAQIMRRVQSTLTALASGTPDAEMRPGRLTRELESQGFGAMAGLELPARKLTPPSSATAARTALGEMATRVADLEEEMRTADRRARLAEDEAHEAAVRANHARERADAARTAAREAATELEAAQGRLQRTRSDIER